MIIRTFAVLATICIASPAAGQEQGPPTILADGSHRLQQVALTTSDLSSAIEFYRDTVGLRLLFVSNDMAFFDLSGTRLMIALDRERGEFIRPATILYFDVDDFAASVARLRISGVSLDGPVETVRTTADGDLKLQQFIDRDGNALAVMGFVPH